MQIGRYLGRFGGLRSWLGRERKLPLKATPVQKEQESAVPQPNPPAASTLVSKIQPGNALAQPSLHSEQFSLDPIVLFRSLSPHAPLRAPQVWLETLKNPINIKLGILDLNPLVFAVLPRLDLIAQNLKWQKEYRQVNYFSVKTQAELIAWSNRRPWRRQGGGKARHGSTRSVMWGKGAETSGPRGPNSLFYMVPDSVRIWGLRSVLSAKLAQGCLHVVDSLDLLSEKPKELFDLIESRFWGISVLFVDIESSETGEMPRSISVASSSIPQYNVMPLSGLDVHSLLKHEHLVITLAAIEKLERRLVRELRRPSAPASSPLRFGAHNPLAPELRVHDARDQQPLDAHNMQPFKATDSSRRVPPNWKSPGRKKWTI